MRVVCGRVATDVERWTNHQNLLERLADLIHVWGMLGHIRSHNGLKIPVLAVRDWLARLDDRAA